jgi:hypothetical protein
MLNEMKLAFCPRSYFAILGECSGNIDLWYPFAGEFWELRHIPVGGHFGDLGALELYVP